MPTSLMNVPTPLAPDRDVALVVGHDVLGRQSREALRRAMKAVPSSITIVCLQRSDRTLPACDVFVCDAAARKLSCAELHAVRRWHEGSWLCCLGVRNEREAVRMIAAGADVTVLRGTSPAMVAALLRAGLRRAAHAVHRSRIAIGDLLYDRDARRLICAGRDVALTPREWQLFDYLVRRGSLAASAAALRGGVFQADPAGPSNAVAVYIGYLRRKLAVSSTTRIETVRGLGYVLTVTAGCTRYNEHGANADDTRNDATDDRAVVIDQRRAAR